LFKKNQINYIRFDLHIKPKIFYFEEVINMSHIIDYEYLVDSAMRVLIRDVLTSVEKNGGLPAAHYFHISFVTRYDGVQMPSHLFEKYPQEITIALQNQFKNLNVYDDVFAVDLAFNGQDERLIVPFCAITSFADPSEDFILRMSADNTGVIGKSKFNEMIGSSTIKATPDVKTEDNVINFSDIKHLLKQ